MARDRSFSVVVAGSGMIEPRISLGVAAIGIIVVAELPFFRGLVDASATNPYAGHVLFVPFLAAALLWVDRRTLLPTPARSANVIGTGLLGLALTAGALAVGAFALQWDNVPLQGLSFVAAASGIVLWFGGVHGIRRFGFVLAFLVLMIPPPRDVVTAIAPSIQYFDAVFSRVVLEILQIPVSQRGVFLHLPGLSLEVAEECAGLRFLPMLVISVAAFARVVLPTLSTQLLLIFLAIPVAVCANAMRVAATGVGAYLIGPHVATGPLHYYIGKGFWACAVMVMVVFALLLRARVGATSLRDRVRHDPCAAGVP